MTMRNPKLLITGGQGRVGSLIKPILSEDYNVQIFEQCIKKKNSEDSNDVIYGDIKNISDLEQAFTGVDVLVHLAGIPDEDCFTEKLMPMNIEGCYNVFETAKNCGIKKIIFASTIQTVWNYPNSVHIDTSMPPRPFNLYACTKIFGEMLGRYYSDKYGISVICIRLGYFLDYDHEWLSDSEKAKMWCSPKDLCQLIIKSIQSDLKYEIFFGLSNNKDMFHSIENARKLIGYDPVDGKAKK